MEIIILHDISLWFNLFLYYFLKFVLHILVYSCVLKYYCPAYDIKLQLQQIWDVGPYPSKGSLAKDTSLLVVVVLIFCYVVHILSCKIALWVLWKSCKIFVINCLTLWKTLILSQYFNCLILELSILKNISLQVCYSL